MLYFFYYVSAPPNKLYAYMYRIKYILLLMLGRRKEICILSSVRASSMFKIGSMNPLCGRDPGNGFALPALISSSAPPEMALPFQLHGQWSCNGSYPAPMCSE